MEVNKQNLTKLYERCTKESTSWWDVYSNHAVNRSISFKNNVFHSAREAQVEGYGVRININGKTGFSFCNNINDIDSVLEYAKQTARFGEKEEFTLPSGNSFPHVALYDDAIIKKNIDEDITLLHHIVDRIQKEYSDCIVDAGLGHVEGYVHLMNSAGFNAGYQYSRQGATVTALRILPDGSRVQIYESTSWGTDYSIDQIVDRIIWKLRFSEKNTQMPFGNYFVILTPKAFSQIMGVVLQGLSGRLIERGISRYIGKFGEKLFGKNFTVYDNPLIDYAPGSYPFDGEGIAAQNKTIIENGYVQSYIANLQSAHRLKTQPTGNASRSYATLPQESFSNIVVPEGTLTFQEMIQKMGTGIIIDQFIGFGQSNTLMGQFSANLDVAWLIVGGEVRGRLTNSMVSDNVMTMLNDKILFSVEREWVGDSYLPYVLCRINYSSR